MPCASTYSDLAGNTSLNAALIALLLQGLIKLHVLHCIV